MSRSRVPREQDTFSVRVFVELEVASVIVTTATLSATGTGRFRWLRASMLSPEDDEMFDVDREQLEAVDAAASRYTKAMFCSGNRSPEAVSLRRWTMAHDELKDKLIATRTWFCQSRERPQDPNWSPYRPIANWAPVMQTLSRSPLFNVPVRSPQQRQPNWWPPGLHPNATVVW